MKIATNFLAGVMTLALGQVAQAAPPKVTGKYAFMAISLCQSGFTATTDTYRLGNGSTAPAVRTINPVNSGLMSAETGYITFTPASAGAANGTANVAATQVEGSALKINNNGIAWAQKPDNFTGPYSFTDTTFNFDGDVFQMTFGNVVNTFAKTVYLVRREGTSNCFNSVTATKQP